MIAALRACAATLLVLYACEGASAADLALDVELDPAVRRFSAIAELKAPGPYTFALHRSLSVQSVTIDGRPIDAKASGERSGERRWSIAAARGATLRIRYGGILPALPALDHRGVLQGLQPMAAAKGTFLPAGSGWYPQPTSAFSYTVRLSLPPDQRGLVAGRIMSESGAGDARYSATFSFPHGAEGIDLMAGPYTVRERKVERSGAEPLRIRTYFYPDLDALADGYLDDSARYIALYSELIGDYPYDTFSVVASPLPTGFGMPTLTYLGADVLKLPFIRATSLGHEVLHNWWGNGVRVDYSRGNWSEGLTTFMADYFYKERESADAAREARLAWLRDFAAVSGSQPLSAFRSRTHGAETAVGYGKAAMVFFMLRDAIGEDAFARGVRAFWAENRSRVAGWDDLRAAFEKASGRDLSGFFEQWIRRAGAPKIDIAEARARTVKSKTELTMALVQNAPAYALQVPIEITAQGRTETRRIAISRERETARLELDYTPDRVRLDPELRVWRVLERSALPPILREWIVAPAPRVHLASGDRDVQAASRTLAEALFESRAQPIGAAAMKKSTDPVLIVGLHRDVDAALAALGLARPDTVGDRGTAQVWTAAAPDGPRVAVVSARDAAAIAALARPLPHYGSQSWLVFEGSRALGRGVWPVAVPSVAVRAQ